MEFNDRRFNPTPHVEAIKKAHAAIYRMSDSLRPTGTSLATANAMIRHGNTVNRATDELARNGHKDVAGQLVDAHQTKLRLREAAQKEQYRPELERRLAQAKFPRTRQKSSSCRNCGDDVGNLNKRGTCEGGCA